MSKRTTADSLREGDGPAPPPSAADEFVAGRFLKWRWYHFYFVLAMFDVTVIVATMVLHHSTLKSFDHALGDVLELHDRQAWVAELGTALLSVNAPGNNIFETRDLPGERESFDSARRRLDELLADPPGVPMSARFAQYAERMAEAEERIFDLFERILASPLPGQEEAKLLSAASTHMAAMDRAQADAMAILTDVGSALLTDQQITLDAYGAALEERTRAEIVFAALVVVILGGVFWYGRRLQRTHEDLLMERERASAERRERLAAVGEVCSLVAHGIRNPLAGVTSSAQLVIEHGTLDEPTRRRVADILTQTRVLDQRISRLMEFARAPSVRLEALDPERILEQACTELRPRLEASGITVERRYDAQGAIVHGDHHLLTQAMIELLGNAIDHSASNGVVILVCTRTGRGERWCELGVVDAGPGMPDEIKDRAFDLFFTRKAGGNGIGLASVKRTAEFHRGSVVVRDADPTGCDVRLRIPEHPQAPGRDR